MNNPDEKGWVVELRNSVTQEPITGSSVSFSSAITAQPYVSLEIRKDGVPVLFLEKCQNMTFWPDKLEEFQRLLNATNTMLDAPGGK